MQEPQIKIESPIVNTNCTNNDQTTLILFITKHPPLIKMYIV